MRSHLLILLGILVFCGCRKKIETISPADSSVFGQWRYVSSSGGLSGKGDPDLSSDNSVEFRDYGKYFKYKGEKKIEKSPFEFREGKCIHGNIHTSDVITVFDGSNVSYSFLVKGDSLFLDAEVSDGFSYVYVKK
jgi:hypothetical protein